LELLAGLMTEVGPGRWCCRRRCSCPP
jgi:hypothetical protein